MTLISCSVFKESILDGSKAHTIRDRKNPPSIGENIYLWWKSRTAEREFLGVTVCTQVDKIEVNPIRATVIVNGRSLSKIAINKLAKADGFADTKSFWAYFEKPLSGFLIHWESGYVTGQLLRPEVLDFGSMAEADYRLYKEQDSIDRFEPSNSGIGLDFIGDWCQNCQRDQWNGSSGKSCPVLMQALATNKTPQWIKFQGEAMCRSYEPRKSPMVNRDCHGKLEAAGQLRLFPAC